jgi:FMN-dependent NADH-azoreductase
MEAFMNILQINASARSQGAQSTRLADLVVERLRTDHSQSHLIVRDLAVTPYPVLDEPALQALFTPAEQRTPEQMTRVALDDSLIAELQGADVLVLAVPMYNFGISAQLKNWLDGVARAQVTFRYTEQGPQGLLTGKTVYVALARGGKYRDTAADSQVPYLKTILGFLGMTDVRFVYAEGLAMGADAAAQAFVEAQRDIDAAMQA